MSVFDHFMNLALKGLKKEVFISNERYRFQIFQVFKEVFRSNNTQYIQNNIFAEFSRVIIGYDILEHVLTFVWIGRFYTGRFYI